MSVGDHLDELRARLILALGGVAVAFVGCLLVAKQHLLPFVAGPLIEVLAENDLSPQLYQTTVADPFMVYLRLSLIGAFVLGGPWVIYQVWRFVVVGLYEQERRAATRFLPVSILLFAGGVAFVWYAILPLTLSFFIYFSTTIPLPAGLDDAPPVAVGPEVPRSVLPQFAGNPTPPIPYERWFDTTSGRLKMYLPDGEGDLIPRVIPFGSANLVAPIITLPDYVNLVLMLLIVFGLSFQMPLAVAAVIRSGLATAEAIRGQRRLVYLGMVVLACVATPGDVVTATVGLIVPLILLFELGIWLGDRGETAPEPEA